MSKLFRRLVAVTLAIVMCFCIGTTVFAADTTDSENTSNINWWEIGWIILSDYVEKLIMYCTGIYSNVDTSIALSIGAAESGYYKVKYMLKKNVISHAKYCFSTSAAFDEYCKKQKRHNFYHLIQN